jgi:putative endopeptidase
VRFAKTGARMIRMGMALVFADLASPVPGQTPPASQSEAETPKGPPTVGGLDLSGIDQIADACTDFYQYACGKWSRTIQFPSIRGALGSVVLAPLGAAPV